MPNGVWSKPVNRVGSKLAVGGVHAGLAAGGVSLGFVDVAGPGDVGSEQRPSRVGPFAGSEVQVAGGAVRGEIVPNDDSGPCPGARVVLGNDLRGDRGVPAEGAVAVGGGELVGAAPQARAGSLDRDVVVGPPNTAPLNETDFSGSRTPVAAITFAEADVVPADPPTP